ncbi:MAG: S8 family serine peptidase [Crocinitomicaceae bacterium]|nr:S8 family peptidase [Flavobacteriales bacterium]NQZ36785.1 S8 family serine peptidase [Crocinitomicaceae bacterium]
MVNKLLYSFSILFSILLSSSYCQAQKFGFQDVLDKSPTVPTTFCIPKTESNISALNQAEITVKYSTVDWLFVTATPQWIQNAKSNQVISDFYFELAPPRLLADTARVAHYVNQVHDGLGGLQTPFTGKDVIIGYVDTGLDFTHEDFKNDDGSTRVLRYWDHTLATGPSPGTYGYGTVWDSTAINNGTCTSTDSHSHGTIVTGFGSGNARANGRMKGMAPESDIIVVESDLNAPNWTLMIADACDYIFKVADTLGKPAIVNLSLGTYIGSHDGNDPASEAMEAMLDSQPGRIIIAAAGNAGLNGKFHVQNTVTTDTSFVWIKSNPSGYYGANTIYFDLWSDLTDATFDFGFGADKPSPDFEFRGMSNFHGATSSIGSIIFDTIWNNGNQIATIESYTSIVGSNYNLQVIFTQIDSSSYLFRFMTTNSGQYDLWSGSFLGYNDFVSTNLPTTAQLPAIANYVLPDSLQTIVSSWNCSEKVISVGNVQNRLGHIDGNGNQYYTAGMNPPGKLALKSSKGPSRHNVVKPDISAAGEVSLAAAPLWVPSIPQAYTVLDSGLLHMRNSGTSMSSPLVAGVAALYLEKCSKAPYTDFKEDMIATAFSDGFTGTLPNFGYGHGKIHALNLLLETNFTTFVAGPDGICDEPIILDIGSTETISSADWSDGSNLTPLSTSTPGDYSAIVYNLQRCISYTDTHTVAQFVVPTIDPITQIGDTLYTLSSHDYQWTLDGSDLAGETNPELTVTAPFGSYTCYAVSADGCVVETNLVTLTVGLESIALDEFSIYPNPVRDAFQIKSKSEILQVELIDAAGKKTNLVNNSGLGYSVSHLSSGLYTIIVTTESGVFQSKITRM